MTSNETDEVLIILNVSRDIEEALIDWLLARASGTGFTSTKIEGHSTEHANMSIVEQVSGRLRRRQFQVRMATVDVDAFLQELQAEMQGANIHYWVLPIIRSGTLVQ